MNIDTFREDWEALLERGIVGQKLALDKPTRLYYGVDTLSRAVFFLSSSIPSQAPQLSEIVRVEHGRREDGRWTVVLTLLNPAFRDTFIGLCSELARSTAAALTEAHALDVFEQTVAQWRTLLSIEPPRRLSMNECRGLAAELAYMLELSKVFPLREAVLGWTGPLRAPYDFRLPHGTIREVKAIRSTSTSVKVSSVAQLDPDPGDSLQLVLVTVNESPGQAEGALTIPDLAARIEQGIASDQRAKDTFRENLRLLGFEAGDSYYQTMFFEVSAFQHYEVGEGFPRIPRSVIPLGVIGAKYEVETRAISAFEVNEEPALKLESQA